MDVLGIILLIVGVIMIIVGIVTAYFTYKYFGYNRGQAGTGKNKDGTTTWTNTTAVPAASKTAEMKSNTTTFYVLLGVTIAMFVIGLILTIFGAYRAFRKTTVKTVSQVSLQ